MKIYFKKGYNKDKPKRWYIYGIYTHKELTNNLYDYQYKHIYDIGTESTPPDRPIHVDRSICYTFKKKLSDLGLKICEDKKWVDDPAKYFVYFRSHADEAEFILRFSNGAEIEP